MDEGQSLKFNRLWICYFWRIWLLHPLEGLARPEFILKPHKMDQPESSELLPDPHPYSAESCWGKNSNKIFLVLWSSKPEPSLSAWASQRRDHPAPNTTLHRCPFDHLTQSSADFFLPQLPMCTSDQTVMAAVLWITQDSSWFLSTFSDFGCHPVLWYREGRIATWRCGDLAPVCEVDHFLFIAYSWWLEGWGYQCISK